MTSCVCVCVFQGIIMLILATDMARHNEILDAFKSQISQGFDFAKEEAVNAVNCFCIFDSHFLG